MRRKSVRVRQSRELRKGDKEKKKPKGVYCKPESLEEMMKSWRENGNHFK